MPAQERPPYLDFAERPDGCAISRTYDPTPVQMSKRTIQAARLNGPPNCDYYEPRFWTKPQRKEPKRIDSQRTDTSRHSSSQNFPSEQLPSSQKPKSKSKNHTAKNSMQMHSGEYQGNRPRMQSAPQAGPNQFKYNPYRPASFVSPESTAQATSRPADNVAYKPNYFPCHEASQSTFTHHPGPGVVQRAPLQHNANNLETAKPAISSHPRPKVTRVSTSIALNPRQPQNALGNSRKSLVPARKPLAKPRQSTSIALKTKSQLQASAEAGSNGRRQQ